MGYSLKNLIAALAPTGEIAFDAGGKGVAGSPTYLKLVSGGATGGTAYYLYIEDDGTVKVHTAVPTADSDGSVVGSQS